MKVISIREPWASLVVDGYKDIENRDWPYLPKYRGPLGIHASKTFDGDARRMLARHWEEFGLPDPSCIKKYSECQLGGIIGIVELVDAVRDHISQWFVGDIGLVLANARRVPFHACRGKLGLFNVEFAS